MSSILDLKISKLSENNLLSGRILRRLEYFIPGKEATLRDVVMANEADFMRIGGFGKTSMKELSAFLSMCGLRIGMTGDDIEKYEKRCDARLEKSKKIDSIDLNRLVHDLVISVSPQVFHENMMLCEEDRWTLEKCSEVSVRYVKLLIDDLGKEVVNG